MQIEHLHNSIYFAPEGAAKKSAEWKLSATLYTPSDMPFSGCMFFCLPGGGHTAKLFDLGEADGVSFSFAKHLTDLGHGVIAMDVPGTGGNPIANGHGFMPPRMAAGYLLDCLQNFQQSCGLTITKTIGCGHSMGGMMTILTHAAAKKAGLPFYDAILLIGSNAGGLDWGLDDEEKQYIDQPDKIEADLEKLTLKKFKELYPSYAGGPRFGSKSFGGETEQSNQFLHDIMCNLYGAGGMMSMLRGSFVEEVAMLTEPLMMAFGEHDIGLTPDEAVKDFTAAQSIKTHIIEKASHNVFAYQAIKPFCKTINDWLCELDFIAPH